MKLFLTSTPRSGNTWLRYILANLYQLQQHAVHTPDALDWTSLSDGTIVQMHWHHSPDFAGFLAKHGFEVVSIARDPLDVLLSILHFSPHEPQTSQWLAGEAGNESKIHHCDVASSPFREYALGPRARALLSVTPPWWAAPGVMKVRYEGLVRNAEAELAPVVTRWGAPQVSFSEALQNLTLEKLRSTSSNQHFWKGTPGYARQVMPADLVRQIEREHQAVFSSLGYPTGVS